MGAYWEAFSRFFSGRTLWATGLILATLEVILAVVSMATPWYGSDYGDNDHSFMLNGFPTRCTQGIASAALAMLVLSFFSGLILMWAFATYLSDKIEDLAAAATKCVRPSPLPDKLQWSKKKVALLFGSLNTFFFFIAFVVVAGGLPPCWDKENNAGIGAPASESFIGSDNIGTWGPQTGWTLCIVAFFLICLPCQAVCIAVNTKTDHLDAPLPQRRPRAAGAEIEMTSTSTSADYKG